MHSSLGSQLACLIASLNKTSRSRAKCLIRGKAAPPIEAGEDLRRAGGEALADSRWKCAVDHDRLKVDNGDRSDHRVGQSQCGFFNPTVELRPEFAPGFGRRTNRRGVDTSRFQPALQLIN